MEDWIIEHSIEDEAANEVVVDVDRLVADPLLSMSCYIVSIAIVECSIHGGLWCAIQATRVLLHDRCMGLGQIAGHVDELVKGEVLDLIAWIASCSRYDLLHKLLQDQIELARLEITDSLLIAESAPG